MTPGLREPVVVNYPGVEGRLYVLLPRSSMARDPGPSSGGEGHVFPPFFLAVALLLLELISRSFPK